jgi:ferredoxin
VYIQVDLELCQSHGQCVFTAPDNFSFDTDDNLQYHRDVEPQAENGVRDAAASCPVAAITLHEVRAPR